MAAGQGEVGRSGGGGLIGAILVPRLTVRFALLSAGVVLGAAAYHFLGAKLLAYLGGISGPFCVLCAGAVWSMRSKADLALSGDGLNSEAFAAARKVARTVRMRSMRRAAWVALCALVAVSPAIANELAGAVWQWMVILGGAAVGEAAYSFIVASHWEEQLIAARDSQVLQSRRKAERQVLLDRLEGATLGSSSASWSRGADSSPLKPH